MVRLICDFLMKNLFFVVVVFFCLNSFVCAQDPTCSPSCTPEPTPTPAPQEAGDPAFLGVDGRPKDSLSKRKAEAKVEGVAQEAERALVSNEAKEWGEVSARMQAKPEKSYEVVMEIWEGNYSSAYQRMAILHSRQLVRSTEEAENLDFMLACLSNAEEQRAACLKLGTGNGLERQLGARRLALLESNPKLQQGAVR